MNDREEVLNLIHQYGFTIDTGNIRGFAELFKDGTWQMDGADAMSGEKLLEAGEALIIVYEDGTCRTKHVTSNIALTLDEKNTKASCQSYVTIFQQTNSFPLQTIFSGHYFDKFSKAGGRWHFTQRVIKHFLVGDMSNHLRQVDAVIPGK